MRRRGFLGLLAGIPALKFLGGVGAAQAKALPEATPKASPKGEPESGCASRCGCLSQWGSDEGASMRFLKRALREVDPEDIHHPTRVEVLEVAPLEIPRFEMFDELKSYEPGELEQIVEKLKL